MTVIGLILLGLVAGTIAAALGVGGGVIFVPAFVAVFGFTQHLAEGTSLAVILGTAAVATWVHGRHGRVDWRNAAIVGGGGVIGAFLGASLALRLDAELLRRLFAVLLIAVAVRLLIHTLRT